MEYDPFPDFVELILAPKDDQKALLLLRQYMPRAKDHMEFFELQGDWNDFAACPSRWNLGRLTRHQGSANQDIREVTDLLLHLAPGFRDHHARPHSLDKKGH